LAAVFVFTSAAAGAWVIAGRLLCDIASRLAKKLHDVCGGTLAAQFACHEAHIWVDVIEEQFVAGTEVIQAELAIGGGEEAMLGAFTVAGEAHFAIAAVLGQCIVFILAEGYLLR
jgi:hypothetical protein